MKSWRIRALGSFEAEAQEAAFPYKSELHALVAKPPRRINRYIRLALIGAHRCVAQTAPLSPATPLYMASEQGSVAETIRLMDDIVVHGHAPMPMPFINVSSNMVGFYLAASLGLTGRNINVARSRGSFGAILELADLDTDLDANRGAVRDSASPMPLLLGTANECVWPLAEHRRRSGLPTDVPLVEGSYWLLVDSNSEGAGRRLDYGTTDDAAKARAWLAAGEYQAVDPHLPDDQRRALAIDTTSRRQWHSDFFHRGHLQAVEHALFTALGSDPVPHLHVVAGDASSGYQLFCVSGPARD